MTDKHGAKSRCGVEIGLKRENAEYEIDEARHFFYASTVPRPNLRTDVINCFMAMRTLSQRARQSQIETRIIDQHHCAGPAFLNFIQRLSELFSKIAVLPQDFPQTEDGCVTDPIFEVRACDLLHVRAAAPDKLQLRIQ